MEHFKTLNYNVKIYIAVEWPRVPLSSWKPTMLNETKRGVLQSFQT